MPGALDGFQRLLAGQGQDGTDFEQAWEVERLAAAIRLAAQEQRWGSLEEV